MSNSVFKREIYIYSEMILKAIYRSDISCAGEALRLYFLAKDWDKSKRGSLVESEFRSYIVNDLKVKDWNCRRWLNSAIEIGLIKRAIQPKGGKLLLTGYRKACGLLGIDRLQPMQAIKIKDLMSKNWRSHIWACFLANYQDRPISRQTLCKLSGVKKLTQINLEKKTERIKNAPNYAKIGKLSADHLTGYKELVHPGARNYKGELFRQLPNTRKIEGVRVKKKTSTLKGINSRIRSSCYVAGKIYRLYCENDRELKKAEKHREGDYLYLKSGQQSFYHAISYAH